MCRTIVCLTIIVRPLLIHKEKGGNGFEHILITLTKPDSMRLFVSFVCLNLRRNSAETQKTQRNI